MGHLPGHSLPLACNIITSVFSGQRVTCASQLSFGPWIEPCGPGLEMLWMGLLRSGAQPALGLFKGFFPIEQAVGNEWREWVSLIVATGDLACLPPSCFLQQDTYFRLLRLAVPSYLQIKIFINVVIYSFSKLH